MAHGGPGPGYGHRHGTNEVTAPAGLPVLGRGAHLSPAYGSCVMEYASVLAGERFSDRPRCTHPALAELARAVNDATVRRHSTRLARLAPALVGTASPDPVVPDLVVLACARVVLGVEPHSRRATRLARRATRAAQHAPRPHTRPARLAASLARCGAGPDTAFVVLWNAAMRRPRTADRDDVLLSGLEQAVRAVNDHLGTPAVASAPCPATP